MQRLSVPVKLKLLGCIPLAAASVLALLVALELSRPVILLVTVTLLGLSAAGFLWLGRDLRRGLGALASELEALRSEKAKLQAKRSRGRRDAFNEVLIGLEERADQVQRDRDNLEQLVKQRTLALQQRNEAMRLVLDNVEQGLATIEPDGKLSTERSRAFDVWFPSPASAQQGFETQLAAHDPELQEVLRMCWEQLVEGALPLELTLEQMPQRIHVDGRHYTLHYRPILKEDVLEGVLLVVSDVSDQIAVMQRDLEQREIICVFERIMRDKNGFVGFMDECSALVSTTLDGNLDRANLMRAIHTIKGNCAVFGVTSVVQVAHDIESAVAERDEPPSPAELKKLQAAWQSVVERVHRLVARVEEPAVDVSPEELQELIDAVDQHASYADLADLLGRLRQERVAIPLRRCAEHASALARRLGKGEVRVEVDASEQLRLPLSEWAAFWASFVHVVRNAVDHGIESTQDRLACGKPPAGRLRFSASVFHRTLVIELSDDGRGIDWEAIRANARERGLPSAGHSDLVDALFADGVSTASVVSDISGRGVGMGAVKQAALALGGTIHVSSTRQSGTSVRFEFPFFNASGAGFDGADTYGSGLDGRRNSTIRKPALVNENFADSTKNAALSGAAG